MDNEQYRQYFKGKNFITQNIIEYGKISEDKFYELSYGESLFPLSSQYIYGVSIADTNGFIHDLSNSFESKKDAEDYINQLRREA